MSKYDYLYRDDEYKLTSRFVSTPVPTRIPQAGEVWEYINGASATVLWADDKTVVYDLSEPYGPKRCTYPTKHFLKDLKAPKIKLPACVRYLSIVGESNGAVWVDKRTVCPIDQDGVVRFWVDDEGEPHVERIS